MVPTGAPEFLHDYYPESLTQESPLPVIARSASWSTSRSLSNSVSIKDDGLDGDKLRKNDLSPADKRNVDIALDLTIFDAVLSGKSQWCIDPKYLIQAGIRTEHGLFNMRFFLW